MFLADQSGSDCNCPSSDREPSCISVKCQGTCPVVSVRPYSFLEITFRIIKINNLFMLHYSFMYACMVYYMHCSLEGRIVLSIFIILFHSSIWCSVLPIIESNIFASAEYLFTAL